MRKKVVIYVPGLADDKLIANLLFPFLPVIWRQFGYEFVIHRPHWKAGETFLPKQKMIEQLIDRYSDNKYKVCLIGQSAGGSAVLNTFTACKKKVDRVVNVCGRLRKGQNVSPTLEQAAKGYPAFEDSVLLFENTNEQTLSASDRKKVLTIKSHLDNIVPPTTTPLEGATNITIPMIGHATGGISAMTIFSEKIRAFFESDLKVQ